MPGHVSPAQVIGDYEDDIWLGRGGDGGEQGGGEEGEQEEEDHVQGVTEGEIMEQVWRPGQNGGCHPLLVVS